MEINGVMVFKMLLCGENTFNMTLEYMVTLTITETINKNTYL
jgi:hypothetical protein